MTADATCWVNGLTIGQTLAATAERFPTGEALVFPQTGRRWSWRAFHEEVSRVARALLALGVRRGEHVAVWATNTPEWVLLQFATAQIGAVLTTVNPAYRPFELEYVLGQSDAVALFLVDKFKTSDYFAMLAEVCPEIAIAEHGRVAAAKYPRLRNVVAMQGAPPPGFIRWDDFLAAASQVSEADRAAAEAPLLPDDPINIQYTSGTTGFPKAAMLSHRNLLLNAFYVGERLRLTHSDRMCIPVPFYHCFGCVLGTLCCGVHGATMVVPAEYFQAGPTLDALERERATVLYGVPTMFIAQLSDPSMPARNITSVRTGIMSGAPCPIEVMKQVVEKFGAKNLTIAYGQTEASPVITQSQCDDPLELRVETVGSPLPGWEVKIIDPASGAVLGDHQPGELCARGHGVMLGYYNNESATRAAIDAEGWLHTGDLAVRLPSGYFKITGRLKDLVIRGGENIYPREIEEFLFTHPAIEQAAVVGLPDPKYGEELCVWIKLKPGELLTADAVRAFCRERLAHFKTPKYVKFVEGFPQTVTGKIQKFRIRELMREELGLSEQRTA